MQQFLATGTDRVRRVRFPSHGQPLHTLGTWPCSATDIQQQTGAAPRSAMVAPLIVFDRVLGFIYLDSESADISFGRDGCGRTCLDGWFLYLHGRKNLLQLAKYFFRTYPGDSLLGFIHGC